VSFVLTALSTGAWLALDARRVSLGLGMSCRILLILVWIVVLVCISWVLLFVLVRVMWNCVLVWWNFVNVLVVVLIVLVVCCSFVDLVVEMCCVVSVVVLFEMV